MARELRLEFHGTFYHIINRGNYRHHVFGPAGVQIAFETCLSRPARSRVGCCTRLWSWATTTTSQWKRGRAGNSDQRIPAGFPKADSREGSNHRAEDFLNAFSGSSQPHTHGPATQLPVINGTHSAAP